MTDDFIIIPSLTEDNIESYFREHAADYFKHCGHSHKEFRIGEWLYTVTIDYSDDLGTVDNISWCKVHKSTFKE